MEITRNQQNGTETFVIDGRIDTATAPGLQALLLPAIEDSRKISLDFSKVTYVSSAGLRVLLLAERTAKPKSASVTLVNVSDEIKEVFEVTGFSDILKVA